MKWRCPRCRRWAREDMRRECGRCRWEIDEMNAPLFFENAGDDRGTPAEFFKVLDREFHFDLDAAADANNHKCDLYLGKGGMEEDALKADWGGLTTFLNPPYSMCDEFIAKAREEADKGATVVMLVPVRSDTKYWHRHIWDASAQSHEAVQDHEAKPNGNWRPGVRCRFIPGRLTFELYVPDKLRVWIKSEMAAVAESPEKEQAEMVVTLSRTTGLPKMAISRICLDYPDEKLLEGAPFPSCVVIFTKAS